MQYAGRQEQNPKDDVAEEEECYKCNGDRDVDAVGGHFKEPEVAKQMFNMMWKRGSKGTGGLINL